ncbi:hypothetical protein [Nitrospira tepida]|nr:hypothetical protein [Nitrospira tepida]
MKGLFFVIGGLLGACMLVLGATTLAQEHPVSVPQQPLPGQAMALVGEKPAASQPQQGKKQRKSQKKKQTTQDADR